jgi:hypothetical protein
MSGYFGGCQIGQLLDLDAKARTSSVGQQATFNSQNIFWQSDRSSA